MTMQILSLHIGKMLPGTLLPQEIVRLRCLIKFDRFIVAPAMFITIGSGLFMALNAGWFHYTWLQVKIPLVVLLAAIHGVHSGKIKRMLNTSRSEVAFNTVNAVIILLSSLLMIVFLVIMKFL
ncbi:CopD family protein [Colwellia sp. 6_MG-2023]|uniref:CopD family protein n=1 Tax=Colwellia sp. 6_MG-2023 TaxID=3062676 RepID=UPI0026E276E9|nr:CopD family protein [Colwellia sp. 6_MG-2023]MDO6487975.1 CopD family protein [Colwellia sp. 6_MG-2023]